MGGVNFEIEKHVIDKHLGDIERYSAFYSQTGMEKFFVSVQGSKAMVWVLIVKQQQEIERLKEDNERLWQRR